MLTSFSNRAVFKLLVCAIVALMVSSCVSYMPIPEGYDGDLSIVYDSDKTVSSTKSYFFELVAIDGRPVEPSSSATLKHNDGRGFSMSVITLSRKVPARTSTLSIRGVTSVAAPILALGGGMYSVEGIVQVNLLPNTSYKVGGEMSKDHSLVWLEDEKTGLIVSDIIRKGNVSSEYIENLLESRVLANKAIAKKAEDEAETRSASFALWEKLSSRGGCSTSVIDGYAASEVYDVAVMLFEEKNHDPAFECFLAISEHEGVEIEAYRYLSVMYDVGLGVTRDAKQAEYWFAKFKQLSN